MSRTCSACRERGHRREMKDGLRHVHELPEGARFRKRMGPGRIWVGTVVDPGPGRAQVDVGESEREHVEFTTNGGDRVEFDRPASSVRPVSPTMTVEPIHRGRAR